MLVGDFDELVPGGPRRAASPVEGARAQLEMALFALRSVRASAVPRERVREALQKAGIEWRSVSEVTNTSAQVATVAADTLSGGQGIDTVSYADHAVGVNANLDGAANDGAAGEADRVAVDLHVRAFGDVAGGDGDVVAGPQVDGEVLGILGRKRRRIDGQRE